MLWPVNILTWQVVQGFVSHLRVCMHVRVCVSMRVLCVCVRASVVVCVSVCICVWASVMYAFRGLLHVQFWLISMGRENQTKQKRTAVTQPCWSPICEEEGCHPGQNFNTQQPFSPAPSTFAMCPHNQDKLVATVQLQNVMGWRPIIS